MVRKYVLPIKFLKVFSESIYSNVFKNNQTLQKKIKISMLRCLPSLALRKVLIEIQ